MVARTGRILVFDPNSLNPYGAELSRVLSAKYRVKLYCAGSGAELFSPATRMRFEMNANVWSRCFSILSRIIWPLIFVIDSLIDRKSQCILIWVRDPWQAMVFVALAKLRRVHWIDHNPEGFRDTLGKSGWERRLYDSVQSAPIHSAALAREDRAVITHPSYLGMVSAHPRILQAGGRSRASTTPRLLYVGNLRPDKGGLELVHICRVLSEPFDLFVVGASSIPAELEKAVVAGGVGTLTWVPGPISDGQLIERLASADLLLAPYIRPTQSGSLILSLTVGIRALAFSGGAIGELLEDSNLVSKGDIQDFARQVFCVWRSSADGWRVSPFDLDKACLSGWAAVLDRVSSRK